ncbi:hypothetical protein ACKKBG_A17135 [Auxenochlorella protothecoides x Auxenochlorella symbiontica]
MQTVAVSLLCRRSVVAATQSLSLGPAPSLAHFLHRYSTETNVPSTSSSDVYVYTSPYGPTVRNVKRLSLFSCACALGAGPIILGLDSGMTLAAKGSIAATLGSFGAFTTGLLHWFVSPYVQRLEVDRRTGGVRAETLTLWGTDRCHAFHLSDVSAVSGVHPLTSFQALGKTFYVDPSHFGDKELLARLAPEAAAVAAGAAAKEEIEHVNGMR